MNREETDLRSAIEGLISSSTFPVLIAIDGGSGAGKTTITSIIQEWFNATVIHLDDFYSADIPYRKWQDFSITERFDNVFRWEDLKRDVLIPLKSGVAAKYYAFNFDSGRPDGTFDMKEEPTLLKSADVLILEGAYSASPHLDDLLDLKILVDVPVEERHYRLNSRESEDFLIDWHEIWDEVEQYYFGEVRPNETFNLVVTESFGS